MTKHELIGQKAPELSLPDAAGNTYHFKPGADGRPTALFFYPKSGTTGCTKEACQFRDALSEEEIFKSTQVQVIGVSPDPVQKQKEFVEKHGLKYTILSDKDGQAREAYKVPKGLLGLTASSRVTFVVDSEGIVKDVFESTLRYSAHRKFVQDWLKTIQAKEPTATTSAAAPAAAAAATTATSPTPAAATEVTSSA